jgi:hypothetical protein
MASPDVKLSPEWEEAIDGVRHQDRRMAVQGTPVTYLLAHLTKTERERDEALKRVKALEEELRRV